MKWSDIKSKIAKMAPMAGTLLGGPSGIAVGAIIATALGTEATPTAVEQAIRQDPDAVMKLHQMELDNAVQLQQLTLQSETSRIAQINETMRAEYGQEDLYTKRWRPTFGYAITFAWVMQALSLSIGLPIAVVIHPEMASGLLAGAAQLMGALSVIWGIALSVVGVNVYQRSQDKKTAAGLEGTGGLIGMIKGRLKK